MDKLIVEFLNNKQDAAYALDHNVSQAMLNMTFKGRASPRKRGPYRERISNEELESSIEALLTKRKAMRQLTGYDKSELVRLMKVRASRVRRARHHAEDSSEQHVQESEVRELKMQHLMLRNQLSQLERNISRSKNSIKFIDEQQRESETRYSHNRRMIKFLQK